MKKEEVVNEFLRSVNENEVITALYNMFGKCVNVSIPFSQKACDTSIDELDFSVRANNSLKRAGVFTIGEIINLMASDGLPKIMVQNHMMLIFLCMLVLDIAVTSKYTKISRFTL